MNYMDRYLTKNRNFAEYDSAFSEAKYVVLGAPFDSTSTYRSGSRFAPVAIREASINLESYSLRLGRDIDDLKIFDAGDLIIQGTIEENLSCLRLVIEEIRSAGKIPIVFGGEHTITHGCVQAFNDVALLSFDAHLDMRDEYLGRKLSHATFMRRICESIGSDKILEIGIRAVCNEEIEFVDRENVAYITSLEIIKHDKREVTNKIRNHLSQFEHLYLTIDMDVLDPSYAPAVGNPVPEGLSPTILLDLLQNVCEKNIVGVDLVEVSPHYDYGVTAFQAAHIAYNVIAFIENRSLTKSDS